MMFEAFRARYGQDPTIGVRAPGRVDLMGSHTDYNEGKVMTLTLDRGIRILARPRDDGRVRLHSLDREPDGEFRAEDPGQASVSGWGRYVQGVAVELQRAGQPIVGADLLVSGNLPMASGLSSSAALEAASITAFERLGGFRLEPVDKARLAQRAENDWLGVPCGILDQYSSILGEKDSALVLDCRSVTHRLVALPHGLTVVLADTRAPRELGESAYAERRQACETAVNVLRRATPSVTHLRDVSPAMLEAAQDGLDPTVLRRARFIVREHARVEALASALEQGDHARIGHLMRASFEGARDEFELCTEPMELMFEALDQGPGRVGCRQAGGGFGGCLVALVLENEVDRFCDTVTEHYERRSGVTPRVFPVSTDHPAGDLPLPAPPSA